MPVPLRFPSLNVPRPLRMQQPRFMSGFQKKTPSVSSNAGDSNVPQMKEPSPPPLKVLTPPMRNNKEKSSLPQFGFMKGNLPQPKAVTSASSATNFTLGQQLSKSSKSKIAEPEQRDRSQVIQNIQSEMPEPEPYFMPLNDVGNEPMALDEDMENKTDTNGKRGSGYTHEAKKRTDYPQTQKKISLSSAVCLDKEGTTGEGNEPVFKLVHTFGDQDFLGSNGPSSQPNSEKDVELLHGQFSDKATTSVSPKCSLISHLDAMSSMGDSCSPENDKERASIFDFFDISQKANSGNDTDAVEDGDSFRSIFNFKSTDADDSNSDNDTEASRGGYFGTSGLLGMVSGGADQSDQAEESGAFHLNLGLSKDTDEDCSDQPSFFNFNNFI
ncbi:hypothetical protein EGW08_016976 [Elysia chlorotica]|uniref:Uncharacterized protein n=1 Tax=Elysia chlorotica TaxID=188477 RepID=A0A433T106_ELYCH|nr:hypothetical protein EGW08_016976 [Elysia chlorotica]